MTDSPCHIAESTPSTTEPYRNYLKHRQCCSGFRSKTVEDEINELLKFYAYNDAIFLAEIYYETEMTEQSLYVYADCLIRANRKEEVYGMLDGQKITDPKLKYLYAKCCFDLNKIEKCQNILLDNDTGCILSDIISDTRVAPHAYLLHSYMLCSEAHTKEAVVEVENALKLNLMMWSAVVTFIKYGGQNLERFIEPEGGETSESGRAESSGSNTPTSSGQARLTPLKSPKTAERASSAMSTSSSKSSTRRVVKPSAAVHAKDVKQTPPISNITPRIGNVAGQPAAPRKSSRLSQMASRRESSARESRLMHETEASQSRRAAHSRGRISNVASSDTENVHHTTAPTTRTRGAAAGRGSSTASAATRGAPTTTSKSLRSTRSSDVAKNVKSLPQRRREIVKQPLCSRNSNMVRSLSGSSNSISSMNDERIEVDNIIIQTLSKDEESLAGKGEFNKNGEDESIPAYSEEYKTLVYIYMQLARIEESVGNYNWPKFQEYVGKLNRSVLLNSSTARYSLGRACFEQAEYGECRFILEELHQRKPWRVEGTEMLSTSLWHLQEPHALSALAQVLTTNSRERAQSWCAAGNCFSLQRQHTQAIECMERAIQLDSRFAYAYTLLGHELIVQDELEKAAGAFRSALLLSPRDYRAWYGLGLVHLKKEQNNLAHTNIQKAVLINPTNRAMLCTLSQVEQHRGRTDRALKLIDKALELNPVDVACRFNKARLLFEAKRNEECLAELNKLKASSPDEAFVFHLLARVHRRIGSTHLALLNYSWAAELDPRGDQNVADTAGGGMNHEEYEDDEYGSPV